MEAAPPASPPLIEFDGVTKVYGRGDAAVQALNGVDLTIEQGEFVAIMGPSGSGKSTAMNILGCLDAPTGGRFRFRGIDVGTLSRRQRALLRRNYLGFVFQGFNLLARTSALENVELPLIYRGTPPTQRRALAARALARVGLSGREDHAPNELSGGQQQRVAIARALALKPQLLLLDEVTSALDPELVGEVLDTVRDLARDGMTMIVVTHEMGFARAVADRVVFMEAGRIDHIDQPSGFFEPAAGSRLDAFLSEVLR